MDMAEAMMLRKYWNRLRPAHEWLAMFARGRMPGKEESEGRNARPPRRIPDELPPNLQRVGIDDPQLASKNVRPFESLPAAVRGVMMAHKVGKLNVT